MTGAYAEIHLHANTVLPPPFIQDRVQYSTPVLTKLSATISSPSPPSASAAERSQQPIEEEEAASPSEAHHMGQQCCMLCCT